MSDGPAARVLVCDDEPQILRALRVILRDAGFEAVTAATGEEALDLAAVKPPEAAILDLMLPDIDGVEVTRRLREWTQMPILVLSAVGVEDRKVDALGAGVEHRLDRRTALLPHEDEPDGEGDQDPEFRIVQELAQHHARSLSTAR